MRREIENGNGVAKRFTSHTAMAMMKMTTTNEDLADIAAAGLIRRKRRNIIKRVAKIRGRKTESETKKAMKAPHMTAQVIATTLVDIVTNVATKNENGDGKKTQRTTTKGRNLE